jgi:V8-like Glu-specific endopeptidase
MRRAGRRPSLAAASTGRGTARSPSSATSGTADVGRDGTRALAAGLTGRTARQASRGIFDRAGRPALWLAGVLSAGALGGYLVPPAAQAAGGVPAIRGRPFSGTTAVGALFTEVNGKLVSHFCTASVVHSRAQNLLITAAHCVFRNAQPSPRSMAFVPGYHNGKAPRGVWGITAVYVNQAWQLHRNVNNDVAFLIAGRPGTHIERHTGAEVLGIDRPPQIVDVIGYPDSTNSPITCLAPARTFHGDSHQMVFDCDGFTTGTSGGPFLARVNAKTGDGTVIGVIGGWQEGGNTPSVSYSPRFFTNVRDLYNYATSGRPPPS